MAVDLAVKMQFYTDDGHTAERIAEIINDFFSHSPFCGAEIYGTMDDSYVVEYSFMMHGPQNQNVIKDIVYEIEDKVDTDSFYGYVDVYDLDVFRACIESGTCPTHGYSVYELGTKSYIPWMKQ